MQSWDGSTASLIEAYNKEYEKHDVATQRMVSRRTHRRILARSGQIGR